MNWIVYMVNEGGDKISWEVTASSETEALQVAWRRYREIPHSDSEMPPKWAKARAIRL